MSQPRMNGGCPAAGTARDRITASTGLPPLPAPGPASRWGAGTRSLHLGEPQHLRTAEGLWRIAASLAYIVTPPFSPPAAARYDARRPIGTDWYSSVLVSWWQRVPGRTARPGWPLRFIATSGPSWSSRPRRQATRTVIWQADRRDFQQVLTHYAAPARRQRAGWPGNVYAEARPGSELRAHRTRPTLIDPIRDAGSMGRANGDANPLTLRDRA